MTCAILGSFLLNPLVENCIGLDSNIALSQRWNIPQIGIHNQLELHRLGLRTGIAKDALGLRIFINQIQTGASQGYMGIDGESTIFRLQTAELRWEIHNEISISAGIVEDLWVESENNIWALRDWTDLKVEEWQNRGQVGMTTGYSFASGLGAFYLSYHTGEGAFRRERNNGKNTAFLLALRPLKRQSLQLDIYGQDGSQGLASARNHRFGIRIFSDWNNGSGGVSCLKAWGLNGNIEEEPLLSSGWIQHDLLYSIIGSIRYERTQRSLSKEESFRAGIAVEPDPNLQIWFGWKSEWMDEQASSISGASSLMNNQEIHIQINGRIGVFNEKI